jgi:hypothetical protein
VETCGNCGRKIGNLEQAHIHDQRVACEACKVVLMNGSASSGVFSPVRTSASASGTVAEWNRIRFALVLAFCAVGGAGSFLPWATLPIVGSINGMVGDGKVTLGIFGAAGLLALTAMFVRQNGFSVVLSSVLFVANAGIAVHKIMGFNEIINKAKGNASENAFAIAITGSMSVGIGLYVIVVAAVGGIVVLAIPASRR